MKESRQMIASIRKKEYIRKYAQHSLRTLCMIIHSKKPADLAKKKKPG